MLRIVEAVKAHEFYVDFHPFAVAFKHRFDDNLPLHTDLQHGNCFLHRSDHYGDRCPGSGVRSMQEQRQ